MTQYITDTRIVRMWAALGLEIEGRNGPSDIWTANSCYRESYWLDAVDREWSEDRGWPRQFRLKPTKS